MIAFIVDGQLEKRAIEKVCERRAAIRTPNLNGRDVELGALAERIDTLVKLLGQRHFPIVVIVDREQRTKSAESIEQELLDKLVNLGHSTDRFIISCADRMIENWIIAGSRSYRGAALSCCNKSNIDGSSGKSLLKQSLNQHSIAYGETTTGVEMLCDSDPILAAERSESFARFLDKIQHYCPRWARVPG